MSEEIPFSTEECSSTVWNARIWNLIQQRHNVLPVFLTVGSFFENDVYVKFFAGAAGKVCIFNIGELMTDTHEESRKHKCTEC